jgi:Metallo-peptidase family M12B Reprolysin-like
MFGATEYRCTTGFYAFGHEIGHNFGMNHDRGTENNCSTTTTYNYGYRDPNAEFRTIMSYGCTTGQCDNMPKNDCDVLQRFSNSKVAYTYNGKPIGNAICDNARQFNEQRALVASFYPAMNCQSNTDCNDKNSKTVDTCNTEAKICVFTPMPRRSFRESLSRFFRRIIDFFT